MLPGKLDLVLRQGSTFERSFAFFGEDDETIDLTNATVKVEVRKNFSSPNFIIKVSTNDESSELTSFTNIVNLDLSSSVTKYLKPGSYVWQMELIFSDSTTNVVAEGKFTVLPGMV